MAFPRTWYDSPSRLTSNPETAIGSMRCTTTPAGSVGSASVSASGSNSASSLRRSAIPSPSAPPSAEQAILLSPSALNPVRSSSRRSRTPGRSILFSTTRVVFSSSAGLWAASSSRMIAASRSGSAVDASTTCTKMRVRDACRRKAKPRPAPMDAPSISPGRSATVGRRPSSRPSSITPRFGSSVVNG